MHIFWIPCKIGRKGPEADDLAKAEMGERYAASFFLNKGKVTITQGEKSDKQGW